MESDSEYKRALNKALVLIGHNDRTAYEVKMRLIQNGFSEDIALKVTEFLINERYINDRRYAEYYVVCYSSRRSISRIRRELLSKGIDKDIVDDALDECDDTEAFHKALEKQLGKRGISDIIEADYMTQKKIADALYRQGFSAARLQSYISDSLSDSISY